MDGSKSWKTVTTKRTVVNTTVQTSIVKSNGKISRNTTTKTVARTRLAKKGPKLSIKRLVKKQRQMKGAHDTANNIETDSTLKHVAQTFAEDDQIEENATNSNFGEDSAVGESNGEFSIENSDNSTHSHDDFAGIFDAVDVLMPDINVDRVVNATYTVDQSKSIEPIEQNKSTEPLDETEQTDIVEKNASDAPLQVPPLIDDVSKSTPAKQKDGYESDVPLKEREEKTVDKFPISIEMPPAVNVVQIKMEPIEKPPSPETPPEPVICWRGGIEMADIAEFQSCAISLAEHSQYIEKALPENLEVIGRIRPQSVWEYIERTTKTVLLFGFLPSEMDDRSKFVTMCDYLESRKRLGVVKSTSSVIKDFYVLPVAANTPMPSVLLPLTGGANFTHEHSIALLGIIVINSVDPVA